MPGAAAEVEQALLIWRQFDQSPPECIRISGPVAIEFGNLLLEEDVTIVWVEGHRSSFPIATPFGKIPVGHQQNGRTHHVTRIAALSSHGGSILQAVIDACENGELPAELVLVISNNSESGALERAREHGIATEHLSGKTHSEPELLDQAICAALKRVEADWVLLAGYMKQLGPKTLSEYQHRIINTHPALLPKYGGQGFYGRRVHEAVIEAGERESGATVHLVEADYDEGPILSQVRVPVRSTDTPATLEERVKSAERKLIVHTLMELVNRQQAACY